MLCVRLSLLLGIDRTIRLANEKASARLQWDFKREHTS